MTIHAPDRNCYLRGCRQPGCIKAASRYRKQLGVEHNRGQYRLRDATQTRVHIERLVAAGWSLRGIAAATGVTHQAIRKLYSGLQEKTSNWLAAAVLAIEIAPPPADDSHVGATGTRRRLQALRVLGYQQAEIAARTGLTIDRVKHLASGHTKTLPTGEAATIARTYRQLCTSPGPSKITATRARKQGWHGPLAWDDIDDPNEQPDTEGVTAWRERRKAVIDVERVAALTAKGLSAAQIAEDIGCHPRSVSRVRGQMSRAGLERAA